MALAPVGTEGAARQPRPFDRALALLDPLFAGSALVVESDDVLGGAAHVGHDEADARIAVYLNAPRPQKRQLSGGINMVSVPGHQFSFPIAGETRIWDTEVRGFFLRVYPSGRKVYALKCRVGGRQHIHTLGVHGSPWTPDQARAAAAEALRRAKNGEGPSAEKKAAREALTVGGLIDRYLADGPAAKLAKRASTWKIDAANLNRHIRPILGNKVANAATKADATRAVRDIASGKTATDEKTRPRGRARVTGGEATARRTAAVASAMFAWGMEHSLVATNPFAGIKLNRAPVRERFLSRDEAGRFLDAIADLQDKSLLSETFADALRLLLLTGARKTEILGLRWSEVDQLRNVLILPPERTKAGGKTGERRISLSAPALEILSRRRARSEAEIPATGSLFVFPAARGEGHAIGLRRTFTKVRAKANLEGLRIHDLRHNSGSRIIPSTGGFAA